jgi:hypothetical protein
LKSAENECDFDLQAMELAEKYADIIPRFAAYFSNQCLPNIKNYVWKPATEQFSTLNWSNNSCESMNNILKLSANWKALKLRKLSHSFSADFNPLLPKMSFITVRIASTNVVS